jgi:chromate transporter
VDRLGWITEQQLLDAVSIGQVTPGPLSTTATFIGYLVGSWPGALLATLGIFLPSFVFVAVSGPLIPRMRASRWFGALLDGAVAAALGLMAGVAWDLGSEAIVDPLTAALALLTLAVLLRFRLNSGLLVLAGAAVGLAFRGAGVT